MTVYCGVDFHARQQTVCYCDTADGQVHLKELRHEEDDTRAFYSRLAGEVIVGLEASGYSSWFIELVEGLGHRMLIGDAAEVRRLAKRWQKNDRRDGEMVGAGRPSAGRASRITRRPGRWRSSRRYAPYNDGTHPAADTTH